MIFKPQHLRPLKNIRPPIKFFQQFIQQQQSFLIQKLVSELGFTFLSPFPIIYTFFFTTDISPLRFTSLNKELKLELRVYFIEFFQKY